MKCGGIATAALVLFVLAGCKADPPRSYEEDLTCRPDNPCGSGNACVCSVCVHECKTDADCSEEHGWIACRHIANTDLRSQCPSSRPLPAVKGCVDRRVPASPCPTPGATSPHLCSFDDVECEAGSTALSTCGDDGVWGRCACVETSADDAGAPEDLASIPPGHDPSRCRGDGCDPKLLRASSFWSEVWIDGEWAEFKPTLLELADSADVAVVAKLVSIEPGRVIQGDAEEDVVTEILVRAEVLEGLRGSSDVQTLKFSLILSQVFSRGTRDASLAAAHAGLPIDRVVLLLRQRSDANYYRTVNGFGIWAQTTRGAVDAPILPYAPGSGVEPTLYDQELAEFSSMEELIDALR